MLKWNQSTASLKSQTQSGGNEASIVQFQSGEKIRPNLQNAKLWV